MLKDDINVLLVSKLIAGQFPDWANLAIRPVECSGWDNKTFHLGDEMSVRLPSALVYVAQVEKEHKCLAKLAPELPLSIPVPLAMGNPTEDYPWKWSIYKWLKGENASLEAIDDLEHFAASLANFLIDLQKIDAGGGPKAGADNFFRGGDLAVYDSETRKSIEFLKDKIELDFDLLTKIWEQALKSKWQKEDVWIHGDLSSDNILVDAGEIAAVIDFGCCGIGDPACDLVIAWTFLYGESRKVFYNTLKLDQDTWARACGWAIWKELITIVKYLGVNKTKVQKSKKILNEVLNDYQEFC